VEAPDSSRVDRWKPRTLVRGSGLLSPRKHPADELRALALVAAFEAVKTLRTGGMSTRKRKRRSLNRGSPADLCGDRTKSDLGGESPRDSTIPAAIDPVFTRRSCAARCKPGPARRPALQSKNEGRSLPGPHRRRPTRQPPPLQSPEADSAPSR
jgi:hypothetical protein